MPQENGLTIDQLAKVFRLEQRRGFNDDAITCGLEEFVRRHLAGALPIVAGYQDKEHFERQRTISRLLTYLDSDTADAYIAKPEDLLLPISNARGVGSKRAARLEKLGIVTIEDLLTYLPRTLEDRSQYKEIGRLHRGETVAVRARIMGVNQSRISRRTTLVRTTLSDETGFLYATWFNQPWLADQLRPGEEIDVYGKIEQHYGRLQISSPVWEPAGEMMEVGRLVPIYPATEGVSDRFLRALIVRNLPVYGEAFQEIIPENTRNEHALLRKSEAIRVLHFPPNAESFERARRSLAFEELFLLQLGMGEHSRSLGGRPHVGQGALVDTFVARLPFRLTQAQQRSVREILADLSSDRRMMRLLQGDVGSGKTIVALVVALATIEAGHQVAMMVPTEILAEQHGISIQELLAGLPVRVSVLTSDTKDKDAVKQAISDGSTNLIIGTHALIEEDVKFDSLGLVIIDEQHRFGVVQRSLIEKKDADVDLLVMSATPIPRTIALTLYGEFEISLIDEMPCGARDIHTVCLAETRRDEVYQDVGRRLEAGEKGYVVLPLVEESEKLDLKAATQVAQELSSTFSRFGVGLIHGRLSAADKQAAMNDFVADRVRLLVATTVIEVGIDVPDATFMVIEHAERFGLSQLHQLRGRIGRSGQRATCFAIAVAKTEDAEQRLTAFSEYDDGFSIAEADLAIRGPGDLLGTKQHGFLSKLRAVDLMRDLDVMKKARQAAHSLLGEGISSLISAEAQRRFGEVLKWLQV